MVAAVINVKTRIPVAPPEGGRTFFGPQPAIACRIGEDGCALQVQPRPLKCFFEKKQPSGFPASVRCESLVSEKYSSRPAVGIPLGGGGGQVLSRVVY